LDGIGNYGDPALATSNPSWSEAVCPMKIRSVEQLVDEIAAESSWRRKELTDLRYAVQNAAGHGTRQETLTRAAVALLYAHWEGFVKAVAEHYLEFVSMQRCRHCDLSNPMLAIVLRSKLQAAEGSRKIETHAEVVEFFRSRMEHRATLPYKAAVRTDANLSSTVLLEIIRTIGIHSAEYEPKRHMIDHRLLAKRNHIAHGSVLDVDLDDYLSLHDEVLELMNLFRNDVENAAATGQYLSRKSGAGV
jgi:hypothetical protein